MKGALRSKPTEARDILVQAGVRLKNQRKALYRAEGLRPKEQTLPREVDRFVLEGLDRQLEMYREEKKRYEAEFHRLTRKHSGLRNLTCIPGIGEIGALKIAARVVDPGRFSSRGSFWSYCGLVELEKLSGGRSYGRRRSRYSRILKSVFKTGAMSIIQHETRNPLKAYYQALLEEKGYPEFKARHALARRLAAVALGVFKSGTKYQPERKEERPERSKPAGSVQAVL